MSDNKGSSGTPDNAAGGGSQENASSTNAAGGDSNNSNQEVVSRDTYLKAIGELKSIKSKFADMQNQFEEMQQTKLQAEGNKDQLIDTLRKQVEKEKTEKQTLAGNFVERSLKAQFEAEAMKQGIKKPGIMDKLVDYGAYVESVDTNTFMADEMDVKSTVEQIKGEYPELFSKESPKINNRISPNDERETKPKQINFQKLSREDANKLAEEIDRMEGKTANFVFQG